MFSDIGTHPFLCALWVLYGESFSVEAWKRNLYSLWIVEFSAASLDVRPVFLFTAALLIAVTFAARKLIEKPFTDRGEGAGSRMKAPRGAKLKGENRKGREKFALARRPQK